MAFGDTLKEGGVWLMGHPEGGRGVVNGIW